MSLKSLLFCLLCVVSWLLILPVLLIVGSSALIAYAVGAESLLMLLGRSRRYFEPAAARALARRMCAARARPVRLIHSAGAAATH